MIRSLRTVCLLLLLIPSPLWATPPLTLQECFQKALSYSEVVKISEQEIEVARAQFQQALGDILPLISFQASEFLQDSSTQSSDGSVGQTFTQFSRPEIRVNARQILFRGLKEITAIKLSKVNTRRTQLEKRNVERLLFQDVATAFYTIVIVERDIETNKEIIGVVKKRISELDTRIELGKSREGELTQEQSLLALLQADLERLLGQKNVAYELMSFLTGLTPMPPIAWKDPIPKATKNIEYYLGQIGNRPDIQAAYQEILLAEGNTKLVKGDFFPTIEAEANAYALRSGFQKGILWDAEFRFQVPIFNYTNFGRLKEAKVQAKQTAMATENLRRTAINEVRQSFEKWQSSLAQLVRYRKAVSLALRNYNLQTEDFKIGRAQNLDVLTAQRTWLDAMDQRNRSQVQSWLDWTTLQVVSGVLP